MNPRNSQIDLDHQAALDEDNNRHWHELAAYVEYGIKRWKGRYDYGSQSTPQGDEDQKAADRQGMGDAFRDTYRNRDKEKR